MTERLIDLLLRLAPRERLLLGVLVLVVLPVALAFGWLVPLNENRQAARAALSEAQALDDWVQARQTEKASLALPAQTGPVAAAIGASALEQSLIERKLRANLSGLETRDDGEIALRFDEINFVDLMRWMDRQDPDWGYRIEELRIDRTERSAYVEARLVLTPLAQN